MPGLLAAGDFDVGIINMKAVIKVVLGFVLLSFAGIMAFLGFSVWAMGSHGFDITAYDKIEQGMTMEQVQNMMGKPSSVSTQDDSTDWVYSRNLIWCMAHISFDSTGVVKTKEHDH